MKLIHLIAIVTIILFYFIFNNIICKSYVELSYTKKNKNRSSLLYITMGVALLLRIFFAVLYKGYVTDVNCFMGWSNRVFEEGFSHFYSDTSFSDYPPGYMYVLYLIGGIRKIFQLDFNAPSYIVLIKLPAIICDMITGGIIYKLAKRHFTVNIAILCSAIYLFNPAILLNSAIWGQVDSVFTLAIVLMCYFIYEKRLPFAYFVFAVGILIKPQTLILTPVLIFGIIEQVILCDFSWKKFFRHLKWGILAILFMVVLMVPFGLTKVIEQYSDTLTSYPYATINAYNIWAMFGLNWSPQTGKFLSFSYNQWGTLFIVIIVLAATFFSFKCKKNNRSKYFILGAFIVIATFTLSVRMHERYMFPALALLMIGFVLRPSKEIFILYSLYSVVHFYNVAHVLFIYDVNNYNSKATFPIILGAVTVILFCYMLYAMKTHYAKEFHLEKNENGQGVLKSMFCHAKSTVVDHNISKTSIIKITKKDFIPILIITVIYSCFALYDLGSRSAPQTAWDTDITGDSVIIDLGEQKQFSKISYFLGNYEKRLFTIETSDNLNGSWTNISEIEMLSVFSWGSNEVAGNCQYIKLISNSEKASVREFVITDKEGNKLSPANMSDPNVTALFDEQALYPNRSTFRDSTYFDEIYHARTAYEYIQGLYSYENTHPPLGKIFIALGMLIFGVNPFGWRIMGTIFGIAMIPFIYMFAKKLLRKSWLASVVCIIFTFDFMHFTQTRIATIDVFVTFFIILMYYFMYQYYEISFYDTPLRKTFIPLGLCGITMGFGMACKWTGVYAGVGLAIIFFITLYRRYKEYNIAVKYPSETTNGIKHRYIIQSFHNNALKTILFCCIFFIVIPIIIYTLSYIPFVDGDHNGLIAAMLKNQDSMFSYHTNVNATHPYSSRWYEWPTMVRPIWYYSGHVSDTVSEGISAFGNPLVWWIGLPAFLYMVYLAAKKKDEKALFLSVAYLAQFLPWTLVTRVTFIYHYFPSVPFVTLMIGYAMYNLVKKRPKLKKAVYVYTALVIILFLMFYPVLSGQPVNKDFVSTWLRWFNSWVLVS